MRHIWRRSGESCSGAAAALGARNSAWRSKAIKRRHQAQPITASRHLGVQRQRRSAAPATRWRWQSAAAHQQRIIKAPQHHSTLAKNVSVAAVWHRFSGGGGVWLQSIMAAASGLSGS